MTMGNKIEILAPAGAFESVKAAACTGASAVYIGARQFSARASAANFDDEEIESAVEYCHKRGLKLYLALNTLVRDDEIPQALKVIQHACKACVDAIIVQDLGLAQLIRQTAPTMPLHASTQMTVHNPEGAKLLYSLGFKRVVLARELSLKEIEEIVGSCPIETEVFVHGALCMCVSGQCEFSALLGGRSGNRGRCAQPCRLPFKIDGGNGYALSLKDLSLTEHLKKLEEIGVTSAKIEGRMKRPEYVAAATDACYSALNGTLDEDKKNSLQSVFSRSGFTDGYYKGERVQDMFGFRSKENVTSADSKLLSKLKNLYKDERKSLPLSLKFTLNENKRAKLEAESGAFFACAYGDVPQKALNVELSREKAVTQLSKTGGTPFYIEEIDVDIQSGLAFSLSAINAMRRECIECIEKEYCAGRDKEYTPVDLEIPTPYKTNIKPRIRARFTHTNVPSEFKSCELLFVPLFSSDESIKALVENGFNLGVEIPRCIFGVESRVSKRLEQIKTLGIGDVLVSNIGTVTLAKKAGLNVHGSFALNIFNSETLKFYKNLGLADVELSQELTAEQIRTLGGSIKRGVVTCGAMPLMVTRLCPAKNGGQDCKTCDKRRVIIDRKNNALPLKCDGITTEILNPVPTYAQHIFEAADYLDFFTLRFTTESAEEMIKFYNAVTKGEHLSGNFTNGLYKRGVI